MAELRISEAQVLKSVQCGFKNIVERTLNIKILKDPTIADAALRLACSESLDMLWLVMRIGKDRFTGNGVVEAASYGLNNVHVPLVREMLTKIVTDITIANKLIDIAVTSGYLNVLDMLLSVKDNISKEKN